MSLNSQQETPTLTVAICTRNRAESLRGAIQSVLDQSDERTELVIINNASTDHTGEVLRNFAANDARVRSFCEPSLGIARARNRALRESRAPIILFFDDDERARPGWVESYLALFRSSTANQIGCAGGPYRAKHLSRTPLWLDRKFGEVDLGRPAGPLTGKATLPGGNCAYRRDLALKLGGFDTALARYEDVDLNLRVRQAGYQVWWLPQAEVDHLIDPVRFRFQRHIAEKYAEGRSIARLRLKSRGSPLWRVGLSLGRVLCSPFLILLQGVCALVSLCLLQIRLAAKMVLKLSRTAGTTRESIGILSTCWRIVPEPKPDLHENSLRC